VVDDGNINKLPVSTGKNQVPEFHKLNFSLSISGDIC